MRGLRGGSVGLVLTLWAGVGLAEPVSPPEGASQDLVAPVVSADAPPVEAPPVEPGAPPKIDPAKEAVKTEPPPLDFLKLRDPFKRPQILAQKADPKTDLELFPAEQFKMVGVITGLNRLRAIVADPNGKTHFVAEKMRMGIRKGVVRKISNEAIKVREKIINVLGQEEEFDIELRLPPENANLSVNELNASEIVAGQPQQLPQPPRAGAGPDVSQGGALPVGLGSQGPMPQNITGGSQ